MNKVKLLKLALPAAVLLSQQSLAIEAAGVKSGNLLLTPLLEISSGRDSNFRADRSEEESNYTTLKPSIDLEVQGSKAAFRLGYSLNHQILHDADDEDNTDHSLNAQALLDFNSRNKLEVTASLVNDETVTSIGELNDEMQNQKLDLLYTFGAKNAMFNVDLGLGNWDKSSKNSANLDDEFDQQRVHSTLYYSISPRTRLLGEVRQSKTDYDSNNSLDNTYNSFLLGATWEATAFTTGSLKFGSGDKSFDAGTNADESSGIIEFDLLWVPLSYSNVNLNISRSIDDGDIASATKSVNSYNLLWKHDWSYNLSSNLSYAISDTDYNRDSRVVDENIFGLGLSYSLFDNMDLSLNYSRSDQEATEAADNYDRDKVFLGLLVGL